MRSKPVMLPVMRSLCRVRKRSMTVLRMRCAKNIMPETVMERLYCGCGQRPRCVDLWCRPRAALHCFGATVLPLCFGNPHVLGEARRAFYHVPGRGSNLRHARPGAGRALVGNGETGRVQSQRIQPG